MGEHGVKFSRRGALVTAAWTAPVVVVASATPAYAGSTDPVVMTSDVTAIVIDPDPMTVNKRLAVSATFTNLGSRPTTALVVQVTVDMQFGTVQSTVPDNVSEDFDYNGETGNSGGRTYTFTKLPPQLSGAGGPSDTVSLSFDVQVTPDLEVALGGSVTVVPDPTPGTGTPSGTPFGGTPVDP